MRRDQPGAHPVSRCPLTPHFQGTNTFHDLKLTQGKLVSEDEG